MEASANWYNINKKYIFGITLNAGFILIEIIYGYEANSLALIADALHNSGDVLGLLIAWFAVFLSGKKPSDGFTYGYKNATVIAAFINALILFFAVGKIAWEAIGRFGIEQQINSTMVIFVAFVGVLINSLTAYFFFYDRKEDINTGGVYLHMVLDALVSLGVIVGGIFIMWKSWLWVDPVMSLVVAFVVLISSWKLFRESLSLMLLGVPMSINFEKLKELISQSEGLLSYHDLRVWPMGTTEVALSVHLVVKSNYFSHGFLSSFEKKIKAGFPISHVTVQLELEDNK